jgi:hypothetical protein
MPATARSRKSFAERRAEIRTSQARVCEFPHSHTRTGITITGKTLENQPTAATG